MSDATAPTEDFLRAEEAAEQLAKSLKRLDQEADSYSSAGKTLDQVALDLGAGDWRTSVSASVEDGWSVLDVPFVALPNQGVFDASSAPAAASGKVRLRPVLAAGLKGNRTLTELLSNSDIPSDPDEARRNYLPQYRVLLPYFWRPAAP